MARRTGGSREGPGRDNLRRFERRERADSAHPQEGETDNFDILKETLDIGDFAEAKGTLFKTKRGERSILAKQARIIAKSLRPLPQSWYGLEDTETRLRKRYLDTILNPK